MSLGSYITSQGYYITDVCIYSFYNISLIIHISKVHITIHKSYSPFFTLPKLVVIVYIFFFLTRVFHFLSYGGIVKRYLQFLAEFRILSL
jgi:hypothetical protein